MCLGDIRKIFQTIDSLFMSVLIGNSTFSKPNDELFSRYKECKLILSPYRTVRTYYCVFYLLVETTLLDVIKSGILHFFPLLLGAIFKKVLAKECLARPYFVSVRNWKKSLRLEIRFYLEAKEFSKSAQKCAFTSYFLQSCLNHRCVCFCSIFSLLDSRTELIYTPRREVSVF